MVAARRLYHVETIPQQDSASTMLNKLARTFAAQVEALKKYRSAGEQTIKVQHVTVNEGGRPLSATLTRGVGTQQIMETNLAGPGTAIAVVGCLDREPKNKEWATGELS